MQYRIDVSELTRSEARIKLVFVKIVRNLCTKKIAVLLAIAHFIDGNHILDTLGIQTLNQV